MKMRLGFVSNSSASSFYVYGWTDKQLGLIDMNKLEREVREKFDIYLIQPPSQCGDIIGLGNSFDEIDHYDENWEDFKPDPPSQKEIEQIDMIAKEYNLPQPDFFSETWFNG